MTKITLPLESLVIEEYSRGQTLDQVASKIHLSKGSVFNIIKKWKSQLVEGDVDTVRKFQNMVNNSGFTIEDCAMGFRMIRMLEKYDLHDDFEKPLVDLTWSGVKQSEKTKSPELEDFAKDFVAEDLMDREKVRIKGNEIMSFLKDIYEPCQRNDVKAKDIIKWIGNLLTNFSYNDVSEVKSDKNSGKENFSTEDERIEIPLVTQVNTYLDSKNQQYSDLKNNIFEFNRNLRKLSEKITLKSDELKKIEVREEVTLQYLNWYKNLKNSLKNNLGIGIEQVIDDFVKMIKDFIDYDFDTIKLIKDYNKMDSLKSEMTSIQTEIDQKIPVRDSLQTEIMEQNYKVMQLNQTFTAYHALQSMGFGLKELKYLGSTVKEIAFANNMRVEEAVKKFLDDVENEYDNKLGFEIAVNKLETKKMQLDKEIPLYVDQASRQFMVNGSLDYLHDKGVTDSDIIAMSYLVRTFIGNNLLSNYDDTKVIRDNPWHFFMQEFSKLKDLKLEIKTLVSIRDSLKIEINSLKETKRVDERGYLESVLNPNRLDNPTNQDDLKPN